MEKKRLVGIILFCPLFIFLFCYVSNADIAHLKNGGLIRGTVAKETEDTIIVDIIGGTVGLSKKDIHYIEEGKDELEEKDIKKLRKKLTASNTIEDQIRNMFKEYIEVLKNYDVEKYKYLISGQSIKSGEGNVKPFQMKNQYKYIYNNPYTIRIARNRKEALLTFKESRKGAACPYIVVYEDNRWKVDLTQMWQRIRFGPGDKWYWVDKWNK